MKDVVQQLKDQGCNEWDPCLRDSSSAVHLWFEFEDLPLLAIHVYENYSSVNIQGEMFKVETKFLVDMLKGIKMLLAEFKERFHLKWLKHTDSLEISLGVLFPYQLRIVTNLKGLIMFVLDNKSKKEFAPLLFMYQRNFPMYERTTIHPNCQQTRVVTKVHDSLVRATITFNQQGNVFFCDKGFTILCHGNHFQLVMDKRSVRVKIDLLTEVAKLAQYLKAFHGIAAFNQNNIKRVTVTGCFSMFIGVFYDEFLLYKGMPNGTIAHRLEYKIDRILKEKKLHD